MGITVTFVDGVKGRDLPAGQYFDLLQRYRQDRGQTMTPAEVGCFLSHHAAYQRILENKIEAAAIFEDDVLLDRLSLSRLHAVVESGLHRQGFVSLGGQEGLEQLLCLAHGHLVDARSESWQLLNDDLHRLHRCVGYVLSAESAGHLHDLGKGGAYIVDDFPFIASHTPLRNFFVTNCVGHPSDLSGSSIEPERCENRKHSLIANEPLGRRLFREIVATLRARQRSRAYHHRAASYSRIQWISRFGRQQTKA